MVSELISNFGVRVCLPPYGVFVCLTPKSHGIQRGCCVFMGEGGVCDILHWIRGKVLSAIKVWTSLN